VDLIEQLSLVHSQLEIFLMDATEMNEAFSALRDFFVGAAYTVFAAGCVLTVVANQVTYFAFVIALIFAVALLTFAWICAMAGREA